MSQPIVPPTIDESLPESTSALNRRKLDTLIQKMNKCVKRSKGYGEQITKNTGVIEGIKSSFPQLKADSPIATQNEIYGTYKLTIQLREEANTAHRFMDSELFYLSKALEQVGINLRLRDDGEYYFEDDLTNALGKKDLSRILDQLEERLERLEANTSAEIESKREEIRQGVFREVHPLSDKAFDMWQGIYEKRHAAEIVEAQKRITDFLKKKRWYPEILTKERIRDGVKIREMHFSKELKGEDMVLVIESAGYPPRYSMHVGSGPMSSRRDRNQKFELTESELLKRLEEVL